MTPRCVVIGVDFTRELSGAGRWVRRVLAPEAKIVLVHAMEPVELPSFLRSRERDDEAASVARDETIARLTEWRSANALPDADVVVTEGRASGVLLDVARDSHADLVVIGAHVGEQGAMARLGSTAERLLRAAASSLVVLHGEPTAQPTSIVVALDDADITESVVAAAGALADRFEARLRAVHVLSNAAYSHLLSMEAATSRTAVEAQARLDAELASEARRWLGMITRNTLRTDKVDVQVPHGNPGEMILASADAVDADLIVMGRYGVGTVIPAVLGSVIGAVTRGARWPVLVVADARR